jgi:hypothetical protein
MVESLEAPRRWRWYHFAAGVLVLLAVVSLVVGLTLRPRVNTWAREQTIAYLEDAFDSEVELGGLDVLLGPTFRVQGRDLVLRHKGRRDVPPLIVVASFDVSTGLRHLFQRPRRIDFVEVEGLEFNIPPRYSQDEQRFPNQKPPSEKPDRPPAPTSAPPPPAPYQDPRPRKPAPVVITQLSARDARMTIVPKEMDKTPRAWQIHALVMRDVAPDRPMPFSAEIDNPLPKGTVLTTGSFGPWASGEPGLTPLEGTYTLADADLGTIKGIGGIVDAKGTFGGVLERIETTGTSTTPDFHLDYANQPIALETTYTSVIDGTNGNTWLDPVHATLGEATKIVATGGIVKVLREDKDRTIDLDVSIENGRLEDVLRLAVESAEPLMTGGLTTKAKLLIPPGEESVARKLQLEGTFSLDGAQFTSDTVQSKIDELSRRAQGRPEARNIEDVLSDFSGRFRMRNGAVTFSALRFTTQGARVQLAGSYYLDGRLDFAGNIRMSAGVSQMVTGKKRFFLRMVDPLFRRKGATEFPIHIRGSVQKPEFGVDVKKTLRRALLPGD